MKVLILQGLPASGKSTEARALAQGIPAYTFVRGGGEWKRVNKDDIRDMLDNGKWSKENEQFTLAARDSLITQALAAGYNVVVDDTNLHPKHERAIRKLVEPYNAEVDLKFFDVPVEECIRRDSLRVGKAHVGEQVIKRFADMLVDGKPRSANWQPKAVDTWPMLPYVAKPGTPKAIIVDIDGTLAHMTGRSPYDYTRVAEDVVDEVVRGIVQHYYNIGYAVLIVSGRKDDCKDITYKWLKDNNVPFHQLIMRKFEDNRNDALTKNEIFDTYIRDNYDVKFVLDDRNRVVERWRALGLKVLQVAPGDF